MDSTKTTEVEKTFNVEFNDDNKLWLTSAYTIRKFIGILGMALPLLLFVFLFITNGHTNTLESISHYFFTRASVIFAITLSTLAIFLIIYKGKEPIDFFTSLISGIAALLIVFFPTGNISNICCDTEKVYSVTILPQSKLRETVHYISAAVFLLTLAFMSFFIFTRSNKKPAFQTAGKKNRNIVFRICGIIMFVALLIMLAGFLEIIPPAFYNKNHLTFWMETVAIEAFGFSWLTKGEAWLKD